jgi:hypothetical protein
MDGTPSTSFCTAILIDTASYSFGEEHHNGWLVGEAAKEILVPFPADRLKKIPGRIKTNSYS